jgi:hypothetical protein
MFALLIRIFARHIAVVATIDGRANYPRDEHATLMPLYSGGPVKVAATESNVKPLTPLRGQMEARHG